MILRTNIALLCTSVLLSKKLSMFVLKKQNSHYLSIDCRKISIFAVLVGRNPQV